MNWETSVQFTSSLAKFLQSLCSGYVEFDNFVLISGHLCLSVDAGQNISFVVNERLRKNKDDHVVDFLSNTFRELDDEYSRLDHLGDGDSSCEDRKVETDSGGKTFLADSERQPIDDKLKAQKKSSENNSEINQNENPDECVSTSNHHTSASSSPSDAGKHYQPVQNFEAESPDLDKEMKQLTDGNVLLIKQEPSSPIHWGLTHDAISTSPPTGHSNQHTCSLCSASFSQVAHLEHHLKFHNICVCNICGAKMHVTSLKRHQRVHFNDKPFRCNFCNMEFTQSAHLKSHKRQHTKEKPFTCEVCNSTFAHSSSLINHRRIHTGDRPHKCHVCDKGFLKSSDLQRHVRTHTGEKPYGCQLCDAKFAQSGQLIIHRKKVHERLQ